MKLRRALHVMGAGALTGALLLGTAPAANADDIRDRQWPLKGFAAEDVWKQSQGKGVTVAVVDSGVDASHPDLAGQVLKGKDLSKEGGSAQEDIDGHGTAMASFIAGRGHGRGNSSGVMGLAPESKILPVRVKHDDFEMGGDNSDGIRYAVEHGADVINISMGSPSWSADEKHAIEYAVDHDAIVVAATGNSGGKKDLYPASYPGVVAVSGIDETLQTWEKATQNSHTLLSAPATNNVAADPDAASGYQLTNGTSDATAYVSAAAALVRSKYPDLTAGQVVNRLTKSAMLPRSESEKSPKLPTEEYGYGIIRPYAALTRDIPPGSKAGPLAMPSSDSEKSGSGKADSQASEDRSGLPGFLSNLTPVALVTIAFVGIVIVVAIVLAARRNRNGRGPSNGSGPGGPAGSASAAPPHPAQVQQLQASSGQFGSPPPPPSNQPPQ